MTIDNSFFSDINVKEILEQSRSVQQKTKSQNSANQVLIEIERNGCIQRKHPPEEDGKGKG